MKILLIAGGWSSERDISLKGAAALEPVLRHMGHEVTFLDLATEFDQLLAIASRHDFAFINLHGAPGEDGLVQAMLENIKCPYQGSGPAGSFLALNKAAAKQIFRLHNLPTPDWQLITSMPCPDWNCPFTFPVFVKSNTGGSSLRLAKSCNMAELRKNLSAILAAGDCAILEPAISGRDLTCGVLGETPLPPVLIEPLAGEYFDFNSKYQGNGAREICPAPLDPAILANAQQLAVQAHRALGLAGVSRSDFILDSSGKLYLLEVNTLPGMTETSLVRREAASIGLDFEELLSRLMDLALKARAK